jgi:putative thioredoxin
MSESPYIIIVSKDNFSEQVIEKSLSVPVLVDFWADWCAPCKMLTPILTQLVEEYQGQFILAKVNIDEQQQLATQYSIRSIPTLKLFRHGNVVEEIMGVQPEPALREMIERHREHPADKLRQQAKAAQLSGDNTTAITLLEQAREKEPNYHPVQLDLAKILIDVQRFEEAQQLLNKLPLSLQQETEVAQLMAQLHFATIASKAPPESDLEKTLNSNPNDLMARYQLSAKKVLDGKHEEAMELLLELMRRDRSFEDDAGRQGLLTVFTLLNHQSPLVNRYRAKMASLLY